MLDKIKQHKKQNLFIVLIAVLLVLGGIALVLGLLSKNKNVPSWKFPAFIDDYDQGGSYTSEDPKITFDGNLDDEAWKNQRWLETEMDGADGIKVKMTSYFGEDGLYLAFNVDDVGVYYKAVRDAAANSGIQLYISSVGGAKTLSGEAYEIMLTAAGTTKIAKRSGFGYGLSKGEVYVSTTLKGEMNSKDCEGYTMEAFFAYDMFGEDVNAVYAAPAIVRSFSYDSDERQWYWMGMSEKGLGWNDGTTWWLFDREGMAAYDVTLKGDDNGSLGGKEYAVYGEDYMFEVLPNEGYYAEDVFVDGEKVTRNLYYKNGKTYCLVEAPEKDFEVKANFKKIPEGTLSVSGKISDGKNPINGVKAWAMKNGFSQEITLASDGSYTATVPKVDGLVIYAEATEYAPEIASVSGGKANIVLSKMFFNEAALWDLTHLYEKRVRLKQGGAEYDIRNTQIQSNSIYASANVSMKKISKEDTRAGFVFFDESGAKVFLALTIEGEIQKKDPNAKVTCSFQTISVKEGAYSWMCSGVMDSIAAQDAIINAATSDDGVPIAVHYCKGSFDVWLDGVQIGFGITPLDKDQNPIFKADAKLGVGYECWGTKAVYSNMLFNGNYPLRTTKIENGWDVSKLSKGIAIPVSNNWITALPMTKEYKNEMSISAKISLPLSEVDDSRAGFYFRNKSGDEVFVALTMNAKGTGGKMFYTLQLISNGFTGWSYSGTLIDTSNWGDIRDAASSSEGVEVSVYVKDGKFTVGFGGYLVGSELYSTKDGKNVFGNDTKLIAGLQTAGAKAKYTNITVGNKKPVLKSSTISPDWDLSKIHQGDVKLNAKVWETPAILWPEYKNQYYVTSDVVLAKADKTGADVRSGYRFTDEKGNVAFIALTCETTGDYSVQVICRTAGGGWNWVYGAAIFAQTYEVAKAAQDGLPFAVSYNNGKFAIWVNDVQITNDLVCEINGEKLFDMSAKVSAGLECWDVEGLFHNVAAYDKRP